MDVEVLQGLLDARYVVAGKGWEYECFPVEIESARKKSPKSWEPCVLTESQHLLMVILCNLGKIDTDTMAESVIPNSQLLSDLEYLRKSGLAGNSTTKPSVWGLLTKRCSVAILPDGRYVAGENITGRFSRWIEKLTREKQPSEEV